MNKKRLYLLIGILAGVILIAAVSWMAGSRIQSPAEAAARTAPPAPSPILVPIESRTLTAKVVTRGTARFGALQTISISPSNLKDGVGLITTLPNPNDQLNEGDVLLTASGRPVFVLLGSQPAYRDFTSGTVGEDVTTLELALTRLGFDVGEVDGIYDAHTSDAVEAWYQSAGFAPFTATVDELASIRELESSLAEAQSELTLAEVMVTTSRLAVESAQTTAESNTQLAALELLSLRGAELEVAQATALSSELAGKVEIQMAKNEQLAAEEAVQTLKTKIRTLTQELELAHIQADIKLPLDEILFVPNLPLRIAELNSEIGDELVGPILKVTNNQLVIDSSLPLEEAPLVKVGMPVTIDEVDLGVQAQGRVSRIANAPGTDDVDGYHIYFETAVDQADRPLDGFSLRLTIPVESTDSDVLVVPVSALTLGADGRSRIQINNGALQEFVIVEAGLTAGGFVEVIPVDKELQVGQSIVIGFE